MISPGTDHHKIQSLGRERKWLTFKYKESYTNLEINFLVHNIKAGWPGKDNGICRIKEGCWRPTDDITLYGPAVNTRYLLICPLIIFIGHEKETNSVSEYDKWPVECKQRHTMIHKIIFFLLKFFFLMKCKIQTWILHTQNDTGV